MRNGLTALALIAVLAGCQPKEVILTGERFDVTVPLDEVVTADGKPAASPPVQQNRSEPVSLGGQVSLSEWTHRGSNIRHLAPHSAISASPGRIWTASIGEGNSRRYRIATAPVVAGGRIFTIDARSGLTATSTGGGTLWQTSLVPETDRGGEAAGEASRSARASFS